VEQAELMDVNWE